MKPTEAEVKAFLEDTGPRRLVVPFQVKQDTVDDDARTFSGLAAVFNDLDLGDDIVHPGAFTKTLREFKRSPTAMPLLNSHDHFNIFSALGQMLAGKEVKEGLDTDWEVIDGPDGDATLARLRPSKRTGKAIVGSMSIGYTPVKFDFEASDEARFGQVRHLREVKLHEVSLVLFPMAPAALVDLASVKTLLVKKAFDAPQLAALQQFSSDLDALLKTAASEPIVSVLPDPAALTSEAPDVHLLDALQVRRLRLLAR